MTITLCLTPSPARAIVAREVHVSPQGDDANRGTEAEPVATIDRARAIMSAGKPIPCGNLIILHQGVYHLEKTLELGTNDSGKLSREIWYEAAPDEDVRITGAKSLPPEWFEPVTDPDVLARLNPKVHGRVFRVDLKAHGITDYGAIQPRGFCLDKKPAPMELFMGGQALTLARWPNKKWATIASTPDGNQGNTIGYTGDRPDKWADHDDIWVHGYWTHEWADSWVKVERIDKDKHVLTLAEPRGCYGYTPTRRFRFYNILEELDRPGEYYIDRAAGVLYVFPPSPMHAYGPDHILVSIMEEPLIRTEDTSYVSFARITLEATRGNAVEINGGEMVGLSGCVIRNIGGRGVIIKGGRAHSVVNCEITGTGDGALVLDGGDRATLTPARHLALNNHIHDYARWVRTYAPAINLRGVGNTVAHNDIHSAPHNGILLHGNDHVIEYNDLHDLCWETSDVGAFYLGRNWTERGNVVRYNRFADIRGVHGQGLTLHGVAANSVYLDDMASGVEVTGNIFDRASLGVLLGGGRDNIIQNNLFLDTEPCILVDARATNWASASVKPGGVMVERLLAMNPQQPPYSERYPQLTRVLDDEPGLPKGNIIRRNICTAPDLLLLQSVDRGLLALEHNLAGAPAPAADAEDRYAVMTSPEAAALGFEPIPIQKIGRQENPYDYYFDVWEMLLMEDARKNQSQPPEQ